MSGAAKKVLVTGARGFIGRRCLPGLAANGYEVHAVSSAAHSGGDAVWHGYNLLDDAATATLLAKVRPTHLLHLAWIAQPGVFWTSRENLVWLASGVRLVDAFYGAGGRRAVGAGSCAEYAQTSTDCIEDETPLAPDTLYGEAKAAMQFALRAAARGRGSWAWARLFFPYGPGEAPGRFIPSVIDGLLRRVPVACTHGKQLRDFVYVDDVADACIALVDGEASGAYNVGTGIGTSLAAVGSLATAALGYPELLRFGERPAPAYDPARIVGDVGKIRREHGWAPRVALADGIQRTIAAQRPSVEGRT
jgi:nucleoside-diphosphate-sugar epimerase